METTTRTILIGTSLGDNPVPRHFAALGRELTNTGYKVCLLVHGPEHERNYVDPRISVLRWPSPRPNGLPDALFFARILRELKPCCIVSNFGSTVIMTTLGALYHVPVRVIWHHTLSTQIRLDSEKSPLTLRLQTLRAKVIWRLATHLVGNSNAAQEDLVQIFGIPATRCRVFWNCLEDPATCDLPLPFADPARQHRFVCVGRFSRSKGQDVVLRAIGEIAHKVPDIKVEFIGIGTQRAVCEQLAAQLGVDKYCVFAGYLPHSEVLKRMVSARATLVPSRAEAFGLVCIESMAVGVPVIGSRTGGIEEVVRDGRDGLLFAPENHQALARQMIEIVNNVGFHRQMVTNCRRRFLADFEISKAVAAQARWLDAIIGSPNRSHSPSEACDTPSFEADHGPGDNKCKFEAGASC